MAFASSGGVWNTIPPPRLVRRFATPRLKKLAVS
jgi:hypothetical protein